MFLYDDIVHCILSDALMSYLHDSIITNHDSIKSDLPSHVNLNLLDFFWEVLFFVIYIYAFQNCF